MTAPDPVLREYSEMAKEYDEKWGYYVDATARQTITRMTLAPTDRVLDVGCGTGELLARLAAKYPDAQLAGLDPVPELPWPAGTFDVVVSCNMFHYITHPVEAVHEMERVLRSGGKLIITDWCDDYLACRLCNLYLRLTSRAHYKTYRQAECAALLRKAGHAEPNIERYKINWLWGLMTAVAAKGA